MDIFTTNKILFFIIFFVPGFISIKVYDLLIPNDNRDFSKLFFDAIAYSAVNFGICLLPLKWLYGTSGFWVVFVLGILVLPVFLSLGYLKILRSKFLAEHVINPLRRPWDWFFRTNKSVWVIVNLSDGKKVGGRYSNHSYASSFPLQEQIYIEQVWKLNEDGTFKEPIEGSSGVIILGRDISFIEFLNASEVKNGSNK